VRPTLRRCRPVRRLIRARRTRHRDATATPRRSVSPPRGYIVLRRITTTDRPPTTSRT
jgi:hypothetical protein